jgi:hypothetical protein
VNSCEFLADDSALDLGDGSRSTVPFARWRRPNDWNLRAVRWYQDLANDLQGVNMKTQFCNQTERIWLIWQRNTKYWERGSWELFQLKWWCNKEALMLFFLMQHNYNPNDALTMCVWLKHGLQNEVTRLCSLTYFPSWHSALFLQRDVCISCSNATSEFSESLPFLGPLASVATSCRA